MTQRNPMNERYQNNGEKRTGKTRKSAASAKPTTKAASSVRVDSGKKVKPRGRMARAQRRMETPKNQTSKNDRYYQPQSEEFRKWRRIWWILIIIALAFTSLSFFATAGFENRSPMYIMLGLGYASLIAAIVIDVTKVRKIRNAEIAKASSSMSKKERKAAEARRAQELAAEEAKRVAKAEKKGRGLFGKKKDESTGEADAS